MKEIRFNVLALAAIGALVLCGFAWALGGSSDVGAKEVLIALGGALIGAIASTMTKLVEPLPEPPERNVPAQTVEQLLDVFKAFLEEHPPRPRARE